MQYTDFTSSAKEPPTFTEPRGTVSASGWTLSADTIAVLVYEGENVERLAVATKRGDRVVLLTLEEAGALLGALRSAERGGALQSHEPSTVPQ